MKRMQVSTYKNPNLLYTLDDCTIVVHSSSDWRRNKYLPGFQQIYKICVLLIGLTTCKNRRCCRSNCTYRIKVWLISYEKDARNAYLEMRIHIYGILQPEINWCIVGSFNFKYPKLKSNYMFCKKEGRE